MEVLTLECTAQKIFTTKIINQSESEIGWPVKNVEDLLIVVIPAQLRDLIKQGEQHRVELQVKPILYYLSWILLLSVKVSHKQSALQRNVWK